MRRTRMGRFAKGASMRSALTARALAVAGAAAFTVPVAAEPDIAYLGLRGSYVATEDGSTTGSLFFDFDEEYDGGFAAGVFAGWILDESFRFEIEGTFRHADLKRVVILRDDFFAPLVTIAGDAIAVGGDAQTGAAMTNLYYDFNFLDGAILPWIGAGVGGVFVDYSIVAIIEDPNSPPDPYVLFDANDNTWVFGYQLMAGVTFGVGEGTSMSVSYRFFQTEDFEYADASGEVFKTDLTQHSVDLALQFHL